MTDEQAEFFIKLRSLCLDYDAAIAVSKEAVEFSVDGGYFYETFFHGMKRTVKQKLASRFIDHEIKYNN